MKVKSVYVKPIVMCYCYLLLTFPMISSTQQNSSTECAQHYAARNICFLILQNYIVISQWDLNRARVENQLIFPDIKWHLFILGPFGNSNYFLELNSWKTFHKYTLLRQFFGIVEEDNTQTMSSLN